MLEGSGVALGTRTSTTGEKYVVQVRNVIKLLTGEGRQEKGRMKAGRGRSKGKR